MRTFLRNINARISVIFGTLVLLSFIVWFFLYQKDGDCVVITVDGEFYGSYDLNQDAEIPIEVGDSVTNVVCISNGYAYMKESKCPDHLCEKQGRIHKEGQSIVCLPNRVVVTIESDEDVTYDVVAQ